VIKEEGGRAEGRERERARERKIEEGGRGREEERREFIAKRKKPLA